LHGNRYVRCHLVTYKTQANPHHCFLMMLVSSNVRQSMNDVILGPFLRRKVVSFIFNLKLRLGGEVLMLQVPVWSL